MKYILILVIVTVVGCGSDNDSDNGSTGKSCGGLLGLQCASADFCNVTDGSCGAADQTGQCEPVPEVCTEIFLPVCGCDGITYSNECAAKMASVSVVEQGECVN